MRPRLNLRGCTRVELDVVQVEFEVLWFGRYFMRFCTDSRLSNARWRRFTQITARLMNRLADQLQVLEGRRVVGLGLLQKRLELLDPFFLSVELILADLFLFEVGTRLLYA